MKKAPILASLFNVTFLLSLLATASIRAGTITVTPLPATGTDAATGLTNINTYTCCIAWGATANVTINGVIFTAEKPTAGLLSASGTDPNYGGSWSISAYNTVLTGNQGFGETTGNVTDTTTNTKTLLAFCTYVRGTPGTGSALVLNFGGLTPGGQYALRFYYGVRSGDTAGTYRPLNIAFNGEGTSTNQQYNGNPFLEDGTPNAGGTNSAGFVEYDFLAASTSVLMCLTNENSTESPLLYGTSLQETAPPAMYVAPAISTQPVGFTNYAGQSAQLSVSASGFPTPVYQWYQNNLPLAGATNAIIATSVLDPTNAGSYYVVVSNYYAVSNLSGTTNSSVVSVVVLNPITEEPSSVTAINGQTATFWVNAVGATNYQWQSNTVTITGATNAVYTTPNLTLAANAASYTVTVTTPDGPTNSTAATLTVVPDTTPPTVFSAATSTNATVTNVVVVYSEAVSAATALNVANYSLNGVAPSSAVAGSQPSVVILTPATALSTNTANFLTIQNVQDLFANTLVTTNVLVFPVNMSLWLRADVGVVTDVNGNVVEWLDQTANANNATQYSGGPTERPTPQSGAINGEPALSFNPANSNYFQVASSPSIAIAGDLSIYAMVNISGASSSVACEILGKTKSSIPASYDYYDLATPELFRGNGTLYARNYATAGPSIGAPHLLAVTMQGTTITQFLDGQINGSGPLAGGNGGNATNTGDAGTWLGIGSRNDLAQFMNGDIAEVMIFSKALSPLDRTNMDNYLGVKYFPFSISQQPAPVTTNQGVTATFSVVASQGSTHFTYQWQESTTNNPTPANIPNATNASYTTGVLLPSDNGDAFDVQIIVPGVSTNLSNPASLTVNEAPPAVVSAGTAVWSQSVIVLIFSEAVDPVTGSNPNNYSLSPSGSVLSAAIGDAPNKVVLTTSPLMPGTAYSVTVQNVMDLFNNTIVTAATSVGVYPTSVALWLEGNAGMTLDGNGYVTEWDDQSGNNNDMYSIGDAYAPLLVANGATNAINGMPAPQFNGSSDYMFAYESSSLAITGDMSVFAVMNFSSLNSSSTNNSTIVSKAYTNLANPYDYYVTSGTVKLYRGNGATYGVVTSTSAPSTNVAHVVDVVMQGTSVTHRLDGKSNGSGTLSTTITDNSSYLLIGARDDGKNHLNGQLAELIVLGAAADTNDTASIEGYLAAKYGILFGPAPTLSVVQSAGNVVLSWPIPSVLFTLEATPTLSPSAWTAVTNAVVASGGTNTVTLPAAGTQMFYRLQEQ